MPNHNVPNLYCRIIKFQAEYYAIKSLRIFSLKVWQSLFMNIFKIEYLKSLYKSHLTIQDIFSHVKQTEYVFDLVCHSK